MAVSMRRPLGSDEHCDRLRLPTTIADSEKTVSTASGTVSGVRRKNGSDLISTTALILTAFAILTLFSTAVTSGTAIATDTESQSYLQRWQRDQELQRRPQRHAERAVPEFKPMPVYGNEEADRSKRQLFFKNRNTEPGVISLAFSLISGTIADTRQAYRNVSTIVRNTINESTRPLAPASGTAEGDQMMMAAAENEISGGGAAAVSTTTAAPVDEKAAGQALSKLLGRNYRGLRKLFNSELRSALKMSPGNVRDFSVELGRSVVQSLRPSSIFSRGPMPNGTATTS